MSKALKRIASLVIPGLSKKTLIATALTVAAVVSGNPYLIKAALAADAQVIASTLSPKPKVTSAGSETRWKADPRAGIPYLVGRCAAAGYQVFQRSAPANTGKFKNYVSVYTGAGPIGGFDSFLANDVAVTFSADSGEGASGYYLNRMWMKRQVGAINSPYLHWTATGSKDTPADHGGMPTEWTAAHELPTFAASLWGMEYDSTRFSGGVPGPKMVGRWVKVYDPRKDDTYPGGSGAHRYADPSDKTAYLAAQATWEWSENPYLHGLMWCLGRYFGDPARLDLPLVKSHGLGLPPSKIDLASFVEGANVADANNWAVAGEVNSADDKWEVLKAFLEAGGGEPIMLSTKVACLVNTPKVSLATITKADVIGDVSVAASTAIEDRINTIWPSYTEEALNWEVVPFDQPVQVTTYLAPDKGPRSIEVSLPLVPKATQMAQLMRYRIEDSRELNPIVIPAKPWTMWLRPGDCFTANEPEWGLNNQKLLILQRKRDPATMRVTFVCRTETDGKHAFALGETATPPDTPALTGLDASVVPPPGGDAWSIIAGSVASDSGTLPGIVITGEVDFHGAVTIVVDYREVLPTDPVTYGGWQSESFPVKAGEGLTKTVVVKGVKAGARYQVLVRYITASGVENPDNNTDLGEIDVGEIDAGTVGGFDPYPLIDEAQAAADAAQASADAAALVASTASAGLSSEITRALGAEGVLTTSLASLSSTVGSNKASADASFLVLTTDVSSLSASLTSLSGTVGANKASADASLAALATADTALAGRSTVLEALTRPGSPSRILNGDFADGWRSWLSGTGSFANWATVIDADRGSLAVSFTGTVGDYLYQDIPAKPGTAYTMSMEGDGAPAGVGYFITRNAANTTLNTSSSMTPSSWSNPRSTTNTVTASAGTTYIRAILLRGAAGGFGLSRIMVQEGAATAWRDDATVGGAIARLTTEEITRTTETTALSSSLTSLSATVGANKASADASLLTLTTDVSALSASLTSLTSTVGANTSAITAEATTRATETGALSTSLTSVSATVGTNTASITAQGLVLADHTGKLTAYAKFTAAAGGDEAYIEMVAAADLSLLNLRAKTVTLGGVSGGPVISVEGGLARISNAKIDAAQIDDLTVGTTKITANAVTNSVSVSGSLAANINTSGEQTINTVTLTTAGGRVELLGVLSALTSGGNGAEYTWKYYRDGTLILSIAKGFRTVAGPTVCGTYPATDTPSAGSHTYDLRLERTSSFGGSVESLYNYLMATEIKR